MISRLRSANRLAGASRRFLSTKSDTKAEADPRRPEEEEEEREEEEEAREDKGPKKPSLAGPVFLGFAAVAREHFSYILSSPTLPITTSITSALVPG